MRNRPVLIIGLVLTLVAIGLLLLGDHRSNIPFFLVLFFLFFCAYAVALFLRKRVDPPGWSLGVIVGFAVLFRLIFLISTPSLSDDVYRYVWDGRVQAAGINPYLYPPNDEHLLALRDETLFPKINHKEVSTIYPPLTELLFRAVVAFHPSIVAMNVVFAMVELLIVFVLIRLLAVLGLDRQNIIVYAWNPLVLVEYAGNSHVDALGVLLLFLAIYACLRSRHAAAAFFLAASFVSKFFSILLFPFLLKRPLLNYKKMNLSVSAVFLLGIFLWYAPFLNAGEKLVSGFARYAESWNFNDAFYSVLYSFFELFFPGDLPYSLVGQEIENLPRLLSKAMLAAAFFGILIACWQRYSRLEDPKAAPREWIRICFIVSGAFLLLNPTLHPWYLLWVLPYLVFFDNRAWILFSGLVALSYVVLIGYESAGIWEENLLVRIIEYLPFLILLIRDAVWARPGIATKAAHAI